MEKILLRNGAKEPQSLVAGVVSALDELWEDRGEPIAMQAVEALQRMCEGRALGMSLEVVNKLQALGIVSQGEGLPGGCIQESIQNIIFSSFEKTGAGFSLVTPIARQNAVLNASFSNFSSCEL